ncbi:MAG: methyltransferase domain-containing protein [Candidatus Cloacimonetes bacterium]|nr:methyltransferase domain-containing protein [Candidatus Cloacimonadota bacterium]
MQYEPIKDRMAALIDRYPFLRRAFFRALDTILLRQKYVKRAIQRYFTKYSNLRYYDAGAGFCQYSWFVLKHYPLSQVHAADLKTEYLSSFANSLPEALHERFSYDQGDLQIYEPPNQYSLITAIDILEHIPDDVATLKHFYDCMQERGLLIISSPSDLDEAARFTAEHVRPGYNKKELEQKVANAGFKILESHFSYGFWGSLAWKMMIRKSLSSYGKNPLMFPLLLMYFLAVLPIGLLMMQLDLLLPKSHGTGLILIARKQRSGSLKDHL